MIGGKEWGFFIPQWLKKKEIQPDFSSPFVHSSIHKDVNEAYLDLDYWVARSKKEQLGKEVVYSRLIYDPKIDQKVEEYMVIDFMNKGHIIFLYNSRDQLEQALSLRSMLEITWPERMYDFLKFIVTAK